jgi:hypothetical protein
MAKDYLEQIGYYFWLIPSIFSCFLSTLLLFFRFLNLKNLRWIGFLQVIFALADLLQCIPWFFGSIYSNTEDRTDNKNSLCEIQESLFKIGILTKCLLSSISTAALAHYIYSKQSLQISKILPPALVLVFYTIVTLITNLLLRGDEIACYDLHDFDLETMSRQQWTYVFCYLLPIFVFCFINFLSYALTIYSKISVDTSIVNAIMTPHSDRVAAFTLISWMAYLPALLFFLFFLFHQINIPLYCLTGLFVSSTGMFGSGYLLLAPWIDKTRKTNLFFFIEKLLEDNEQDDDGGMKLSDISSASMPPL